MIDRAKLFAALKSAPTYDPTHVYVISRVNSDVVGPTKVGLARDPQNRLQTFQTAAPFPIALFKTFFLPTRALAHDVESHFHRGARARHLHGEWFSCGPQLAEGLLHLGIALSILTQLPEVEPEAQQAVFDFITGSPA